MAAVSNGRGLNLCGAVSTDRFHHDSVALANERISMHTLFVRRSALKSIGKFWSGKVGGSGARV
jgi:hypothetical protein